jgi:teichuronic acid biosynthesis glycosyltransferase TuaC
MKGSLRQMTMRPLKILVLTAEWPAFPGDVLGIFISNQVNSLIRIGENVDVLAYRGKRNPFRYLQAYLQLGRRVARGYDIIHAHNGQTGLLAVLSGHQRVVVTFHGSDVNGIRDRNGNTTFAGRLLQAISRYVAGRAGAAIVVDDGMKEHLPARKYHTLPCGVDPELFKPRSRSECRRQLGLSQEGSLVLFVGDHDRPVKRHWLAAAVVELVSRQFPCRLIVARRVPHEQMPVYLSACDALLVTSSSEGSPTAVREAIACNLPVVSVNVGDVQSRIAGIEGCVVCSSDDPSVIARDLETVLRRNTRIDGWKFAAEWSENTIACKLKEIYESLLTNN